MKPKISVKSVDAARAVSHILKYGTMHTDSIVTSNKTAEYFLKNINSSIAMHNASTPLTVVSLVLVEKLVFQQINYHQEAWLVLINLLPINI